MKKLRALVRITDYKTNDRYEPGEVFEIDRTDAEVQVLVQAGAVEVVTEDGD